MKTDATAIYKQRLDEHIPALRSVAATVPAAEVGMVLQLANCIPSEEMGSCETKEKLCLLFARSPGVRAMLRAMGSALLALGAELEN